MNDQCTEKTLEFPVVTAPLDGNGLASLHDLLGKASLSITEGAEQAQQAQHILMLGGHILGSGRVESFKVATILQERRALETETFLRDVEIIRSACKGKFSIIDPQGLLQIQ